MIESVDVAQTICQYDIKLVLVGADWKTNIDTSYNTAIIKDSYNHTVIYLHI